MRLCEKGGKLTDDVAGVLDPLRRLVVEELEEDGSGMFYSDSDSIASSNTAG